MALQRPSFTTSRFVETYDMGEVDDAIDRIFDALAQPAPALAPADVQALRFTPTRLREGYTMDEVDNWLDEAAAALAQRDGSASAAAVARQPPTPAAYAPTRSEAIVEVADGPRRWPLVLVVLVVLAVLAYVALA
jgi:DivIVA domain-containing protein